MGGKLHDEGKVWGDGTTRVSESRNVISQTLVLLSHSWVDERPNVSTPQIGPAIACRSDTCTCVRLSTAEMAHIQDRFSSSLAQMKSAQYVQSATAQVLCEALAKSCTLWMRFKPSTSRSKVRKNTVHVLSSTTCQSARRHALSHPPEASSPTNKRLS